VSGWSRVGSYRGGSWLVVLLLSACAADVAAAEDPAISAARAALDGGQPGQAVTLLQGHPAVTAPGPARVLLARARLALGDLPGALAAVDSAERLAGWPSGARGDAAQVAALARVASGDDDAARRLLAIAIADGWGDDPACLALAAELAAAAGDRAQAVRLATMAWNQRPRSASAAPAAMLLARLAGTESEARTLLAEVRALPGLTAADRLAAAEQLCRVLLTREPGACLVITEQELARSPAATSSGLPLLRALALAALDPRDGLAALDALPALSARDPAALAMTARLRGQVAAGQHADPGQRLERARAAAELGRWDEVRALVGEVAPSEPIALALLARAPGADLRALSALPTAADPVAALGLGAAFVQRGDLAAAWSALAPALLALERDDHRAASVLHWAIAAARTAAPAHVVGLEARLRDLTGTGAEIGEAWCREAERLAAENASSGAAWLRAAQALPDDHAWRWPAAARAARAALDGDGDLEATASALRPAQEGDADAERLRCRFLLAQVEARRGQGDEARRIAETLRVHADADQLRRIDHFIASLTIAAP